MKFKILITAVLLIALLSGCGLPIPSFLAEAKQPAAQPAFDTSALLSEEDAKAIALDHARLSAEDVTGLWVELDYDDGRPEYDVRFRYNYLEYEYEIHGESGRILSYDRDD